MTTVAACVGPADESETPSDEAVTEQSALAPACSETCGNIDGFTGVTVTDGIRVLRIAAGLDSPTDCQRQAADVNGDGAVTTTDGVNVLRAAADLPAVLECPELGTVDGIPTPQKVAPLANQFFKAATGTITLNWNPVANATGYAIRVGDETEPGIARDLRNDCSSHYLCMSSIPAGTQSLTLPVLPGHRYKWWIQAIRADGKSNYAYSKFAVGPTPSTAGDFTAEARLADSANVCVVDSYDALVHCRQEMDAGHTKTILFSDAIDCTNRDCVMIYQKNDIVVGGLDASSGIFRTDGFNASAITVAESNNVLIYNMRVNDGPTVIDFGTNRPVTCQSNCAPQGNVFGSHNVQFLRYTSVGGKSHGISFANNTDSVVANSSFSQAGEFGVIFYDGSGDNVGMTVDSSRFFDNRSNGILLTGNNASVTRNTFSHNHFGAAFMTCGQTHQEPCNGGQLLVMACNNVIVEGNVFEQGRLDEVPSSMWPMDIEIGLEPEYDPDAGVTALEVRYWSITTNPSAWFSNDAIHDNRFHDYPGSKAKDVIYLNPGIVEYSNQMLDQ